MDSLLGGGPDLRRSISVWHHKFAPQGTAIFNPYRSNGTRLRVGHTRALFTRPSVVTVAYGDSSGTPRGLWEVSFRGSMHLISESNRDYHCNISSDDKWAVVSTLGPVELHDDSLDVCARAESDWTKSDTGYVACD